MAIEIVYLPSYKMVIFHIFLYFTRGHINHQPAMDICWGYGRLVTWRMKPPILASERSLLLLAEDFLLY